jgi:hypothetical protein
MPVIPALERLRLKDLEFKDSLVYKARPCIKKTKPKATTKRSYRIVNGTTKSQ